jgi:hypothetical protein
MTSKTDLQRRPEADHLELVVRHAAAAHRAPQGLRRCCHFKVMLQCKCGNPLR